MSHIKAVIFLSISFILVGFSTYSISSLQYKKHIDYKNTWLYPSSSSMNLDTNIKPITNKK